MKSKKRIWLVFFVLLAILFSCSCENSPEKRLSDSASRFMEQIRAYDTQALSSLFDGEDNIMEEEGLKALESYLKEVCAKLSYEISQVDPDAGTVTVHCTYVDSSQFFGNFVVEAVKASFAGELRGEMSQDEKEEAYETVVNRAKEGLTETYREGDFVLPFQETDGQWTITEADASLLDVITAGCASLLQDLDPELFQVAFQPESFSQGEAGLSFTGQLTPAGVLLTIRNEGSLSLEQIQVRVMFQNETEDMLQLGSGSLEFLGAGEETVLPVFYYGEAEPVGYSLLVSASSESSGYADARGSVTAEAVDGENSVLVRVTNRSGHILNGLTAAVLYYREDQLVFFEAENLYNVNDGLTEELEFYHPVTEISYDRYELMITQAYYME